MGLGYFIRLQFWGNQNKSRFRKHMQISGEIYEFTFCFPIVHIGKTI